MHLLRDMHALNEAHPLDSAVQKWTRAVRATYDAAKAWLAEQAQAPPEEREALYVTLTSQTHELALRYARARPPVSGALQATAAP